MSSPHISCRAILVIDDDADTRDALTEILADEGYEVSGVANGREALAYLREAKRPSLILLDMMMPEMDGWQLRLELKKDPDLASIPVVILSAHEDVRDAALVLGASDYLRKPLAADRVLEVAERFCRAVFLN